MNYFSRHKKWLAYLILMTFVFTCIVPTGAVFAEEERAVEGLTGEKTAALVNPEENRYQIDVQVPGMDGKRNEHILMLDVTESVGTHNWDKTVAIIQTFGEKILADENENNVLTIMTFGISAHKIATISNKEELKAFLQIDADGNAQVSPNDMIWGVSATNCEGALQYMEAYIEANDSNLKNVYVTFVSDGETNMSMEEVPWQNLEWHYAKNLPGYTGTYLEQIAKYGLDYVIERLYAGSELDPATKSMGWTKDFLTTATREELQAEFDTIITETELRTGTSITCTKARLWLDRVWAEVYKEAGWTYNDTTGYMISDVQDAFINYDIKYFNGKGNRPNLTLTEMFLLCIVNHNGHYKDAGHKGPQAAIAMNSLAEKAEVNVLRFKSRRTKEAENWMNPANGKVTADIHYYECTNYSNIYSNINTLVDSITTTPYNNVTVTDYMSKWVNLSPNSIKIYDDRTGKVIYSYVDGWLIDNPPVAGEPVTVEKVNAEDYAAGGSAVEGNVNGEIYKITWKVKDEALMSADQYRLSYEVTVDTNETGFEYAKDYPANGITTVHYKDENGDGHTVDITVPNVKVNREDKGGITVVKETTGNTAPEGPFGFKLFVKEELASPYTSEIEAAEQLLKDTVDSVINEDTVCVTTGSAYTLQGTTMSHYVFALFNNANTPVTMAVTSGSAVEFEDLETLNWMNIESAGSGILGAIKDALLKAYTNLFDMLKGLYCGLKNENTTVIIAQEALEPVVKAGQFYNDALAKDAAWKEENSTASALQITIGNYTYTTDSPEVVYNKDFDRWELAFEVAPGADNAVNISIESTTGSVISYTIAEDASITSDGNYIDTEIFNSAKNSIAKALTLSEWVTLGNNIYGDSYVFQNNYKTISGGNHWYEDPKKDEPTPKPPVTPEEIIDDPEVPLGDIEVPGEPVMEEELEDPEVPLGDAPATGDSANAVPFMVLLAAAIGGLAITRRKFN